MGDTSRVALEEIDLVGLMRRTLHGELGQGRNGGKRGVRSHLELFIRAQPWVREFGTNVKVKRDDP
jgi:hypothetical protein